MLVHVEARGGGRCRYKKRGAGGWQSVAAPRFPAQACPRGSFPRVKAERTQQPPGPPVTRTTPCQERACC